MLLGNFHDFLSSEDFFFQNLTFSKNSFRNTYQSVKQFVGPDLVPNCLQRSAAVDKI